MPTLAWRGLGFGRSARAVAVVLALGGSVLPAAGQTTQDQGTRATWIWVEGEKPATSTMHRHPWWYDKVRRDELSGGVHAHDDVDMHRRADRHGHQQRQHDQRSHEPSTPDHDHAHPPRLVTSHRLASLANG